jgi:hypothetical protein
MRRSSESETSVKPVVSCRARAAPAPRRPGVATDTSPLHAPQCSVVEKMLGHTEPHRTPQNDVNTNSSVWWSLRVV